MARRSRVFLLLVVLTGAAGCGAVPTTSEHPAPTRTAAAMLRDMGGPQAPLPNLWMADARTGYAWGYARDHFRLWKTEDGGSRWLPVPLRRSPAVPPFPQPADWALPARAVIRSAQALWISWVQQGGPTGAVLHLLGSRDGGRTWAAGQMAVPSGAGAVEQMDFVSPSRGWMLLAASNSGAGQYPRWLYATRDGGRSWQPLSQAAGAPPGLGALWASGGPVRLRFRSARNGWVSVPTFESNQPVLARTTNGGRSWTDVGPSLPTDPGDQGGIVVSGPVFSGPRQRLGVLLVAERRGTNPLTGVGQWALRIYRTRDGGSTWALLQPTGLPGSAAASPLLWSMRFTGTRDGWIVANGSLFRTQNGGRTWSPVTDPALKRLLHRYPQVEEMQFISPQTGWLLLASPRSRQEVLLRTATGGRTWQQP